MHSIHHFSTSHLYEHQKKVVFRYTLVSSEMERQRLLAEKCEETYPEPSIVTTDDSLVALTGNRDKLRRLWERVGCFGDVELLNEIGRMFIADWDKLSTAQLHTFMGDLVDEGDVDCRFIPIPNAYLQGAEPDGDHMEISSVFVHRNCPASDDMVEDFLDLCTFMSRLACSKTFFCDCMVFYG